MVLQSCKVEGLKGWSTGGGQGSQLSGANVLTLILNRMLHGFSELVWMILEKRKICCPYWGPNPRPSSSYCGNCTDYTMKTTVY